jgi:chitin synthase
MFSTLQEAMAKALKELKNNVSFAFLMMNAVFVILVFLLQLEKESIHINWPFGTQTNVSYQSLSTEVFFFSKVIHDYTGKSSRMKTFCFLFADSSNH